MPVFVLVLKKIAPYVKYAVFIAVIAVLTTLFIKRGNQVDELTKAMDIYKRQMSGQLTTQEQQFEQANQELGIAKSQLMSQDALLQAAKNDKIASNAALEAFKKKYNADLESYQRTIAQLTQQLQNGKTIVKDTDIRKPTDAVPDKQFDHIIDPKTTKLSYEWDSGDGRFILSDPDVFISGNETFKLQQNFRITGEIYKEKAGFLQTSRLTLEEVVSDGNNSDGTPKYKTVNTAKVVDSKFNYTEVAPDAWVPKKGVFRLTGIVTGNLGFNNGLTPRFLLGTGLEFLQIKGLGIGIQLYLDVNKWQESGFGISLSYRPTIRGTQLNIGLTAGLATQFQQPFQSYIPMAGIEVFLW